MEVMDALPLATTDYPGNQPLATSRRGIQGRQRRQVNVRPREDDEASSGPAARSGNQNAPRGDGSGASTAPRFVPMMYVPGKARQESGAASPAGPAYSGRPASSGGAAAGRYGAQPDSGRYGAQPGSAESMLNTTRGLFKLRPRRNIRVKSVDALEDDAPLPPRADDEDAPSYSTGFLRDAPATGSLARRERTNVRDMLCARSQVHQPSLGAPALGAPPLGAPTLGGPTPGAPTPYPALGAPDPLAGPDQQSDLHMLQPVADLYAQYSHHNPHAGHAHQGSEPAQQRPLVFEDNRPFFLDDEPLPLPGESVPQEMDRPDMEQFENGEHEALENPATDPLFSPEQLPPGIDPYGSMMQPPHETMELPGGSVDPYLGGMSHPQGLIAKPFQTPTESYEDRIAALKARMQQSSMVPTNPQEETLDQRKQRILGKLYEQKFGPPAGSEPTGYESLEEKKARIFENLRRKHNLNTDQLLGVGDSRARAPVAYGRSLSMGDTLDDREDLLLSEYGSGPTPDGSVIPGSQPIPRFEYRPTTAPPSDFRPVVDEEEAPIERQDAQRDVVRSDIPVKAGSQSSVKSRSQSPVRSGSQSPVKSGSQSPVKSGSQSPVKSGSQSPVKSGSQSPVKSGSQSPVKSGSQSPVKSGSQSPVKSDSQSPVKSGSQSPVKLSSQSPVKSGSQSPVKSGPPRRQLFELETPAQHQSQAPTEEDEDRETRTSAFVKLRPVKPSRPSSSGEASNQGSFQIRAGSGGKSFLDRPEGLERSNSSGSQGQGSSRSQGESPSDDVISVDSGFHDKMANEAKPAPKSAKSSPEPEDKRRGSTSSSASGSSKADSAVLPPKSPGVARRNYLKPWAVSATADKPATAAIPKKAGPPTKPKPGAAAPAPQQRAKSTPPSRSKSTTNLVDVGLSIPERRERSASLYKDGDSIPEPAPFSRNSRVRSSTKAWEQRQAEAKAKLAAQQSKQLPKTAPKTAPKPVKKPAGPSSAIVGKVTLSADSSNEDKPSHSPRKVTNYDKPWRMGAKSRQSSPHRTGTPSSSSGASSRAQSPAPRPRTTSTSRAQSPAPRPRTTSDSHSPSRRGSQDLLEHGGVLRPPKNPVKGQGSAGIEGGPRSPEREEENRPVVNELDGAQQTTTPNTDGNKRASAMSAEEYSSLLDLAADWLFGGDRPVLDVAPVHGASGQPNGANDVGYHEHMDTNIENETESGFPTNLQLSNGEPLSSVGFEDLEAMTSLPEDCPSVGRADISKYITRSSLATGRSI